MTSEVGSGQVAIFPTLKGFRKAVVREVDGQAHPLSEAWNQDPGVSRRVCRWSQASP
jgi:hypothetical protein